MTFWSDPYPHYRALHEQSPVLWADALDAWVVTGRGAVDTVLRSGAVSSAWEAQRPDTACPSAHPRLHAMLEDWFMLMDPPAHQRLRRAVRSRFTRRAVAADEAAIRAAVREWFDGFPAGLPTDLVDDFARPLSHLIVARVLGLPTAVAARAADMVSAVASYLAQPHKEAFAATADEAAGRLVALYRDAAADPAPDGVPALMARDDSGLAETPGRDALGPHTAALLTFAGQETTSGLVSAGLVHLLLADGLYAALAAGRADSAAVVEELLRYDTPVPQVPRVAVSDFELEGCRIGAGDRLVLFLGAANRDWGGDPRADELDTAPPRGHLAFGAGAHYCLGAPLARTAARVAFEEWAARFPCAALLEGEVRWATGRGYRGLERALVVPAPAGSSSGDRTPAPRNNTATEGLIDAG